MTTSATNKAEDNGEGSGCVVEQIGERFFSDAQAYALVRGFAFAIFAHPYDVIRMRMHAYPGGVQACATVHGAFAPHADMSYYHNSWTTAKHMWQEHGIKIFLKGASIPMVGQTFTGFTFFTCYSKLISWRESVHEETMRNEEAKIQQELHRFSRQQWEALPWWQRTGRALDVFWREGGFADPVMMMVEDEHIMNNTREGQLLQKKMLRFQGLLQNAENLPFSEVLLCAMASGAVCGCFSCPMDFIRSRYVTADLFEHRNYTSVFQSIATIYRQGGVSRFTTGWGPSVVRDSIGWTVLIGTYGNYKRIIQYNVDPERLESIHPAVVGAVGGSIGAVAQWLIVLPIEKVKTVMQTAPSINNVTFSKAVQTIYNKYGMKGFYRGLSVTLFRAMVIGATTYASVEVKLSKSKR